MLVMITLGVVQMISVRLGIVTGKGLTALIREQFSLKSAMVGISALFISNSLTAISEFFGIAAALELFGISKYIGIPISGFIVWWLIVKGSYQKVEKLFLILSALFVSYIAVSFIAKPDWGIVAHSLVVPSFEFTAEYLALFVATIATSMTPYMQVYAQSSVIEKGLTLRDIKWAQADAFVGSVIAMLIAIFIVITTATTLFPNNIVVDTAQDAARALGPLAGQYATLLFAFGLFGASMLAAGVLPLTTAFSTCEAFGWRSGVGYSFKQAPIFYSIFTLLIILGVAISLIPGIPLIRLLIFAYVLNGFFLPIELYYMLKLSNNKKLMDKYTNGWIINVLSFLIFFVISIAAVLLLLSYLPINIFGLLGLN
jgi:Mn2+/Fe2+ NRAMP family transporter